MAVFGKYDLLYASICLGLSCLSGKRSGIIPASEDLWEEQGVVEMTGRVFLIESYVFSTTMLICL